MFLIFDSVLYQGSNVNEISGTFKFLSCFLPGRSISKHGGTG